VDVKATERATPEPDTDGLPVIRSGGTPARRGFGSGSVAGAVTKFALSGLAALVLVGIGDVVIFRHLSTEEAIADARRYAQIAAGGILQPSLSDGILTGDEASLGRLDLAVRTGILGDAVRVKIWTPEGRVVYSDEPRLIGAVYPLGPDERTALRTDQVAAEVSEVSAPENRYERKFEELLEVYLPVSTPDGHELLFEVYLPFSSVAASARRIWLAFLPALLVALIALGLVQIPLAWSMARRIRHGLQEREQLLRRAIQASDAERRRIASDLHDGAVQDLAGISYTIVAAADRLGPGIPTDVRADLRRSAEATRQTMRELRTLLVGIYPPNLHSVGLRAALSDALIGVRAQGIETVLDATDSPALRPGVEALLFRAAQEALRNVVEHAEASAVHVRLFVDPSNAVLVVEDNGRGFSTDEVERRRSEGHIGLRLLADLAAGAGARLDVASETGRGTTVRLEVPTS